MLDARYSHLYFCQSLNRLQRGLSAIAELLVTLVYAMSKTIVCRWTYYKVLIFVYFMSYLSMSHNTQVFVQRWRRHRATLSWRPVQTSPWSVPATSQRVLFYGHMTHFLLLLLRAQPPVHVISPNQQSTNAIWPLSATTMSRDLTRVTTAAAL